MSLGAHVPGVPNLRSSAHECSSEPFLDVDWEAQRTRTESGPAGGPTPK